MTSDFDAEGWLLSEKAAIEAFESMEPYETAPSLSASFTLENLFNVMDVFVGKGMRARARSALWSFVSCGSRSKEEEREALAYGAALGLDDLDTMRTSLRIYGGRT